MFAQTKATEGLTHYSTGILATTWILTSICILSLGTRLYLRWKRVGRLYWDDFFVVLSLLFTTSLSAQVTVSLSNLQQHEAKETPLGNGSWFVSRPAVQLFFYSAVWSVKISFIIFFRRLSGVVLRDVLIYRRVVLGVTIITFLLTWSLNPYHCWATKGIRACNGDPMGERLVKITFPLAAALDIVTDLLIMAIPFMILRYTPRLAPRQKLILTTLFSLVLLTMGVALARVIISLKARSRRELTVPLLIFLAHVEAATAIVVACAGSFRALFTSQTRAKGSATPIMGCGNALKHKSETSRRYPRGSWEDAHADADAGQAAELLDVRPSGGEVEKKDEGGVEEPYMSVVLPAYAGAGSSRNKSPPY